MDDRVARLETNIEHIQTDVAEMKGDIRRLAVKLDDVRDSVTALLNETKDSIYALRTEPNHSINALRVETKDLINALRDDTKGWIVSMRSEMQESFAALKIGRALDKVWWLLITAAQLGVMARGFKWI